MCLITIELRRHSDGTLTRHYEIFTMLELVRVFQLQVRCVIGSCQRFRLL